MERLSLEAIAARDALARGKRRATANHSGFEMELLQHGADVWLAFRRDRTGGIMLRTPLLAAETPDAQG